MIESLEERSAASLRSISIPRGCEPRRSDLTSELVRQEEPISTLRLQEPSHAISLRVFQLWNCVQPFRLQPCQVLCQRHNIVAPRLADARRTKRGRATVVPCRRLF